MSRLIDADLIQYTMLYKENWLKGAGVEAQGAWKKDIDAMPTVDPVRHGKWIEHKDYPGLAYLCSECGYFTTSARFYFYCPHCGAKMGEGVEE